jgi:hypothetical protein
MTRANIKWGEITSKIGLIVAIATGLGLLGSTVHGHYPIQTWLIWRYLGYWLVTSIWGLSCLSSGHWLCRKLTRGHLPWSEHMVLSFGLGVLAFGLATFVIGLCHGFGGVFFVALPLALLALGARPLARSYRNWRRHTKRLKLLQYFASPRRGALLGAGLVGIAMMYIMILTPENVAYDARWYHLPVAEHYVAAGGVVRFNEGWFLGVYPQLATWLYTWAFSMPGVLLFDRVELCGHVEFVIFLATLCAIPPLTRRLLRRKRVPLAWVGLFLFPGTFIYDSGLHVAADRIAAFWAPLIYLSLFRAWPRLDLRYTVLVGTFIAAAALTKYTAVSILFFPIVALVVRGLWLAVRHRLWLQSLRGVVAAGAVSVLFSAAHWLKNWVWYGDPVYPLSYKHLTLRPWTPDTVAAFENWFYTTAYRPERSWEGLLQTLKTLGTYSFIPNNWPQIHGVVPLFGSMFTLTLLCLPFLKGTKRIWGIFLAGHSALFIWYWMHHFDRYLQIILPWMVAGTVATLVLIWNRGVLVRVAISLLIAFQVAWGSDAYFITTHQMMGVSPVKALSDLASSGYRKDKERLHPYGAYWQIGNALPDGSTILIHEEHLQLGLRVKRVSDWIGTQGGISYSRHPHSSDVYKLLEGLGVTHIMSTAKISKGYDSLASDLSFYRYYEKNTGKTKNYGGLSVAEVNDRAADTEGETNLVAVLSCDGIYPAGIYRLEQLAVSPLDPAAASKVTPPLTPLSLDAIDPTSLATAEFVVTYPQCKDTSRATSGFRKVAKRPTEQLWWRKN